MIGPPASKFRTKKFRLTLGSAGAALASGSTFALPASVGAAAGEVSAGEVAAAGEMSAATGAVPGAGGTAGTTVVPGAAASGAPGAVVVAGAVVVSGAAGTAGDAPISAGEGAPGLVAGGADGACAKAASARVTEHRLTISVFFIFSRLMVERRFRQCWCGCYHKVTKVRPAKSFLRQRFHFGVI